MLSLVVLLICVMLQDIEKYYKRHFWRCTYFSLILPKLKFKSITDFIQGMTSYILEKLTERKKGANPMKTDSVAKKITNSLKKFVETLVPKKYFNRKMTLTKMTEQLISRAKFSQKRRFRNRAKYLNILKSCNYEESEE